ncbi:ParA family protein [Borreliella americana]|uniref:ParA family protein n=1 Tax=Borreliella americana TaxID=478807 RepID=UPI001E60A60D|nr:ParA family protein [Borreliella americana]MCD2332787.1 ParA family protein [Borreliella americana]MCD2349797.1 ParA family protein [Borreliella americana]MCD2382387.1 ParA family protein [Borreliella americana]
MDSKKSEIISISNIKGGVGKSVLTIIFSFILRNMDKKVLLVDLDPQNSLTSYFLKYIKSLSKNNVYSLLKEDYYVDLDKYLTKIHDNVYLIPSHPSLHLFNKENTSYKELFLKHRLERTLSNYNFDYVMIDTPPNLDSLLDNALNITNKLIVPIQVERFSVESLSILMKYIEKVSMYMDRDIDIYMIENQFMKNRNTFKSIENSIKDKYGKYIKGKIHFYNKVKVFINNLQEPNIKEPYYQECLEALKNILGI